jgi:hypothetical protein
MFTDANKKILLNNKEVASTIHTNDKGAFKGTTNLANNPKHYEIQRNNNFEFYIEGLSKTVAKIENNTYAYDNADDVIRISVAKAFVPHFTQNVIEVKRGNNTMKFAGVPTFSNGQIELNDYIGAGTKDILMAWQKQSYDVETEKVGLASDYKKIGYLLEYTPDYQLIRTWKLVGCWISAISESDYAYDSSDKHTVQVTIEYDKAFLDTSDNEG